MKLRNNFINSPVSRRRCLGILGSSVALPIAGAASPVFGASRALKKITWTGRALGADADITLYTDDEVHARETLGVMVGEIKRLEQYFSLFKENSLIQELNRGGFLNNPPDEFHELLSVALDLAEKSGGRFDPTVQPLFMALKACARQGSPQPWDDDAGVRRARRLINYKNLECCRTRISFAERGMGITLNGIAQGYITDRAVGILKNAGFAHTLVNFGEYSALQPKPGTDGWRIQLGDARRKSAVLPVWNISNSALAASTNSGYVFDGSGGLHHMLDPHSGSSARYWQEIYVEAPDATLADAASTALFATPPGEIAALAGRLGVTRAFLVSSNGDRVNL